jgi:hypothetical protein
LLLSGLWLPVAGAPAAPASVALGALALAQAS